MPRLASKQLNLLLHRLVHHSSDHCENIVRHGLKKIWEGLLVGLFFKLNAMIIIVMIWHSVIEVPLKNIAW